MGVNPKIGVVKHPPNHPFVHRVWNHYKVYPFWGVFPLFLETPILTYINPPWKFHIDTKNRHVWKEVRFENHHVGVSGFKFLGCTISLYDLSFQHRIHPNEITPPKSKNKKTLLKRFKRFLRGYASFTAGVFRKYHASCPSVEQNWKGLDKKNHLPNPPILGFQGKFTLHGSA